MLYLQIPSEREIIHRLKAEYGEESFSCATACDLYSKFSEDHKEVKTQLSAGKIMISVFWDSEGVILVAFLPHVMSNMQCYSNLLQTDVRQVIREKRLGKLSM
jgi:hypothetical protein